MSDKYLVCDRLLTPNQKVIYLIERENLDMSDLNRGIMKFKGADNPKLIAISSFLVFGSIVLLILWALQSAYAI